MGLKPRRQLLLHRIQPGIERIPTAVESAARRLEFGFGGALEILDGTTQLLAANAQILTYVLGKGVAARASEQQHHQHNDIHRGGGEKER